MCAYSLYLYIHTYIYIYIHIYTCTLYSLVAHTGVLMTQTTYSTYAPTYYIVT